MGSSCAGISRIAAGDGWSPVPPVGPGQALAVRAAITAIAVAPTKMLSTGVATSSAQRRTGAYPATATTSHFPRRGSSVAVSRDEGPWPTSTRATATTLTGGPADEIERCAMCGREARSAGVSVACPCSSSRAEALIGPGDVACGAASVQVGDVGGEERSGHRAGRRHLRRGRVRLVVRRRRACGRAAGKSSPGVVAVAARRAVVLRRLGVAGDG